MTGLRFDAYIFSSISRADHPRRLEQLLLLARLAVVVGDEADTQPNKPCCEKGVSKTAV